MKSKAEIFKQIKEGFALFDRDGKGLCVRAKVTGNCRKFRARSNTPFVTYVLRAVKSYTVTAHARARGRVWPQISHGIVACQISS